MNTPSLILHIPHASTIIPFRDGYLVDDDTLRAEQLALTDWHTDDLFANEHDIAVVAPFSRIFCDPERFTDDAQEVMSRYGMGVCYTHTDAGQEMRRIDAEQRERILNDHYRPHHERLSAAVRNALKIHGRATIIDCHSFPAVPLHRDLDQAPERPDYNIGTDAFHTPPELVEAARTYFAQQGQSLWVDRPYSGSLVPAEYYHREPRVRSIMLEVNRARYLQPGSDERSATYAQVKAVVQGFLEVMRSEG